MCNGTPATVHELNLAFHLVMLDIPNLIFYGGNVESENLNIMFDAPVTTRGFTLIELMVTIAVLGILLAVAIPGLQSFVVRNRLAAINNDLMTSLNLARSEAIRRATTVSVCRTNDNGVTCAGTWSDGWMVFVNNDNDTPAVKDGANETLLRVFPSLPAGYTLNATANFTNYVTYQRSGSANNIGTFVVCNNSDETTARGVTLTRLRPRIAVDTNADGIPNTDSGNIGTCEAP